MKVRFVTIMLTTLFVAALAPAYDEEELASYSVRWNRGGTNVFGKLTITDAKMVFKGDTGEETVLPLLHIDVVNIVDVQWIQVRSNRETGVAFGMNDVYNFGIVGDKPDPDLIDRVNKLISDAKIKRVATAKKLEGEKARYMVSKAEAIGDDVGLLIITEENVYFYSDTGGESHAWSYDSLTGVELPEARQLLLHTTERSVIKFGAFRVYDFTSQTGPFSTEDLAYLLTRIAEARTR